MKARLIFRRRTVLADNRLIEILVWNVPLPVEGSSHDYKYSLAFVVNGECVIRYDNERGKGDHKHVGGVEQPYDFTTLAALQADFLEDVRQWIP